MGHTSIQTTVDCTKAVFEFLTGYTPTNWVHPSTLARWNKEIAALSLQENHPNQNISQFFGYGIMADESTQGEKKILIICFSYWNFVKNRPIIIVVKIKDVLRCNADTASTQALQICNETSMDPKNCHFWLTDNTAYMASKTGGAVAKFNKISQSQSFQIPCGLHAVHIALMNFENAAFGKIDAIKGLSLKEHPYNVLNLAFYLHDGYDLSDKDNPLNLKASVIRNLYKILFDYDLTKYQQLIRQRWLYELKTAKQYLERYEVHKQFAQYFLAMSLKVIFKNGKYLKNG
jgi:hypothetical protein